MQQVVFISDLKFGDTEYNIIIKGQDQRMTAVRYVYVVVWQGDHEVFSHRCFN
jgi:hypothetical protein